MSAKDGGPAYPIVGEFPFESTGMTMRQAYKLAAMTVLLAMPDAPKNEGDEGDYARVSGKIADAMLAEDEEAAKR